VEQWIQLTIDGITLGGVYAVIALGYTLVYGVLRMINFAHGELFMMGAFAGFYTLDAFENHSNLNDAMPSLTIAAAIFAGMVTAIVVAIVMERVAYRPLRHAPRLAPLISAIGVSILLRNIMLRVTDARRQVYPQVFPRGRVEFLHDWFDVNVTYIRLFLVLLSILFLVLLYLFIQRTKTGTAIRAVAEDRDTAALMGINVDRTIVLTFVSGAALAGAAGVCYGMFITNASHNMGFIPGIKAFTAAVLGGIGSVPGAMAGGYFLGLSESYATRLIGAQYKDVVAFVLLVAVLIFRPWGIFGKREDRRA
jgi:branched-chain amino acid transport system permease protein